METDALPQYMRIAVSVAERIAEGQFAEGDEALAALLHTYESAVGPRAPEPLPLKED